MVKGTLDQAVLTLISIYVPNVESAKFIMLLLTREHMDGNIVVVGNFITSLSPLDQSTRQNVSKDIRAPSEELEELEQVDIYIGPYIPKKLNTHSYLVHMECSPG